MSEAHARAVLKDLLEERGVPLWLHEFATHRELVYRLLKRSKCKCVGQTRTNRPVNAYHEPNCALGQLLRAAGGEQEVTIQRDLGHAQALTESSEYWRRYWTQEMSDLVAALRRGEYRERQRLSYDPAQFNPQTVAKLNHAGVLEIDRFSGWIRIPRSIYACGQCTAVGPMPHYPGCQS